MADYVLVHGAWHGGWCWRKVAERLRAAGHGVLTPTLTGLGERAHPRNGGWLPYPPAPRLYRHSRMVIEAAAVAARRPREAVTAGVYLTVLPHDDPEAGRAELDAYTRAYYGQRGRPPHGPAHRRSRPWPLLEQVACLAREARSWN